MRFGVGFLLVFIGIILVQSAPVVRQANEILGLDSDFDEFLAEMADLLPPDQYEAFQQELFELIMNQVATGEVDEAAVQGQFMNLLQKYLGAFGEGRSDGLDDYFFQKFVGVVVGNVSNAFGKH